jgi:hypothetical protein
MSCAGDMGIVGSLTCRDRIVGLENPRTGLYCMASVMVKGRARVSRDGHNEAKLLSAGYDMMKLWDHILIQ